LKPFAALHREGLLVIGRYASMNASNIAAGGAVSQRISAS
jgi:hypothetical protein